jgi:hypothetical protein
MPGTFGVRAFFSGGNAGLRQLFPNFKLSPSVGVRQLAANAAISQKYDQLGNFKGVLGPALSDVKANSPTTFVRSFSGGDIHFLDTGQVSADPILETFITYEGTHCFGNPGALKSDSVYLIVSIYPPSNPEQAAVFKIPDDNGGGLIEDFEAGQDSTTGGGVQIFGGQDVGPKSLIISVMVMGDSLLGSSKKVKDAVSKAVHETADKENAAEGQVASPEIIDFLASAFSAVFGGLLNDFGLTDQVRGRPQVIKLRRDTQEDDFVPTRPLQQSGPISFNFATPLLTDGDASYMAFFRVVTRRAVPD